MTKEELKQAKAVINDAFVEKKPEELMPLVPFFPKAEAPTDHSYYRIYSPEDSD